MLLSTPFKAVTKPEIELCAADASGLTVRVVGVLAAEGCSRSMVTPVMALLTTLLALLAAKLLIEKLASCAAWVWVSAKDARPPSPPEELTVMALAAPVAVPAMTSRAPAVVVMMLAVTPGLLLAELMAEAMPARVLWVVSILIDVEAPPTAIVRVPVPTTVVEPPTNAWDVSVAGVARLFTCREYWPATASALVVADAMFLSATVAAKPANCLGSSRAGSASFSVSSALVKVPYAETWESRVFCWLVSWVVCAAP